MNGYVCMFGVNLLLLGFVNEMSKVEPVCLGAHSAGSPG
jgi:hypothetical protein